MDQEVLGAECSPADPRLRVQAGRGLGLGLLTRLGPGFTQVPAMHSACPPLPRTWSLTWHQTRDSRADALSCCL